MTLKSEEINAIKLSKILVNVVTEFFQDYILIKYPNVIQKLNDCYLNCISSNNHGYHDPPYRNNYTKCVYEKFDNGKGEYIGFKCYFITIN
jgi:hypothetical protein